MFNVSEIEKIKKVQKNKYKYQQDKIKKSKKDDKNEKNEDEKEVLSEKNCMSILGKDPSDWQKIVDISDEMKRIIKEDVKECYLKRYGKSSSDSVRSFFLKVNRYLNIIPPKDRLASSYTIIQLSIIESEKYIKKIIENYPNWKCGEIYDISIFDDLE